MGEEEVGTSVSAENRGFFTDLKGEWGKEIVEQVRKAVYAEYDRAGVEGDASAEQIKLQKKHVEAVVAIAERSVVVLREQGVRVSEEEDNLIRIEALLHDAKKIAPEVPKDLRLLTHGADSAEWAGQLLLKMGFKDSEVQQVKLDIEAHMGMPFVERALGNRMGVLPEHVALVPQGYPEPTSVAGAVVRAADFLSSGILGGRDRLSDPQAGCLDRYMFINLGIQRGEGAFEKAWSMSISSLGENVERLKNPKDDDKRVEAAKAEQIIGGIVGEGLLKKAREFESYIKSRDGGLSDLTVLKADGNGEVDVSECMKNYYVILDEYRKKSEVRAETADLLEL